MQRSVRLRLNDIIRAIDGAEVTIESADFETFQSVYHMARTAERSIEIISEASRHVPQALKEQYPDIPWKQIAASATSCGTTTESRTTTSRGTSSNLTFRACEQQSWKCWRNCLRMTTLSPSPPLRR